MRKFLVALIVAGSGFGLVACGHGMEQRAATGAAAGLVLGGPVGAAVGAGVGAVISKTTDK